MADDSATRYMIAMNSGKDQLARTPDLLMETLDAEFKFDFDPCPPDPEFDGLSVEWGASNYANPPYKEVAVWLNKAVSEKRKGRTTVLLLPVRSNTRWFHDILMPHADEVRLVRGALRFKGYAKASPFASMIVVLYGSGDPRERRAAQWSSVDVSGRPLRP